MSDSDCSDCMDHSDRSGGSSYCRTDRHRIKAGVYDHLPPGIVGVPVEGYCDRKPQSLPSSGRADLSIGVPVNPLSMLVDHTSGLDNQVMVHIRRRNSVMTLSWGEFSGIYGASGLDNVTMNFSFKGLPHGPMQFPIRLKYNGEIQVGYVKLDPDSHDIIQIHHNFKDNEPSVLGAQLYVYGSSINWVSKS